MKINKVMHGECLRWWLLVVASLSAGAAAAAAPMCERGRSWWDRELAACRPCTRCDPAQGLAVRLPCDLHRDTVCHPIQNIQIFNEPSERFYDYDYDSDDGVSDVPKWDLQISTLTVAASGCIVFFVVVIILSLYHAKQWKILKKALQSDVKDLSAKLKLMESDVEPAREQILATNHHIYCNIHATKNGFLGPTSGKKLANFYTQQEKQPPT